MPQHGHQDWTPPRFVCPDCRQDLTLAGIDQSFRTPARNNINQWRKVELLVRSGFIFSKHALPYPEKPPATLSEAREFVKGWQKPNQIAAHEPPHPVSGSGAPVHRTLDSLPAPGSGGGR